MTKKVRRVRVYTRLTETLRDRVTGYCAASGIAERAVFEAALGQYIDGTSDMTLVLRRLDRLGRAEERIHRDIELLSEAFENQIDPKQSIIVCFKLCDLSSQLIGANLAVRQSFHSCVLLCVPRTSSGLIWEN